MFILYNFVSISLHILLGLIKLNKLLETQLQASIINISYILAAGWYYYLASTLEYLNHIYQKKLEECCTLFTLYSLEIFDPIKEQNTISEVARQGETFFQFQNM